jgi:colanic acid biosynthesis protein WcaH
VYLNSSRFRQIVENTPLVSIDLCCINKGHLLLGERCNEPLKGAWFTPGGRIRKNEPWKTCLERIAKLELGLDGTYANNFEFMEVRDHFYPNSIFGNNISTHYLNLSYCIDIKHQPNIVADGQHSKFQWVAISSIIKSGEFHPYLRHYAKFLIGHF